MKYVAGVALFALGGVVATAALFGIRQYRINSEVSARSDVYDASFANSREIFALSTLKSDVVMVGDSITQAGPWSEMLGCRLVANRGLGGSTSASILPMIPSLIEQKPEAVFLAIGVNDINMQMTPEETRANVAQFVDQLAGSGIAVYVSPTFPVTAGYNGDPHTNLTTTRATGAAVREAAKAQAEVIEIPLADENGYLLEDFAIDGLHLTAKGYAIWRDTIKPVVERHTECEA